MFALCNKCACLLTEGEKKNGKKKKTHLRMLMGEDVARLHMPDEAPTPVTTTLLLTNLPVARAEAAQTGVGVGTGAGMVGVAEGVTVEAGITARGTVAVVLGRWTWRTDVAWERPVLLPATGTEEVPIKII